MLLCELCSKPFVSDDDDSAVDVSSCSDPDDDVVDVTSFLSALAVDVVVAPSLPHVL